MRNVSNGGLSFFLSLYIEGVASCSLIVEATSFVFCIWLMLSVCFGGQGVNKLHVYQNTKFGG